jgi:hypothetical protein
MISKLQRLLRRKREYIVTLCLSNAITDGRMYEFSCKVEAYSRKQAYAQAEESFKIVKVSAKSVRK